MRVCTKNRGQSEKPYGNGKITTFTRNHYVYRVYRSFTHAKISVESGTTDDDSTRSQMELAYAKYRHVQGESLYNLVSRRRTREWFLVDNPADVK